MPKWGFDFENELLNLHFHLTVAAKRILRNEVRESGITSAAFPGLIAFFSAAGESLVPKSPHEVAAPGVQRAAGAGEGHRGRGRHCPFHFVLVDDDDGHNDGGGVFDGGCDGCAGFGF